MRTPRYSSGCSLQAWALFKGKYKEGVDKPDPPTWKTRLRCALNKSNDFDEMVTRSQLDISDPYKVYKIIPEGVKRGIKNGFGTTEETSPQMTSTAYLPKELSSHSQVAGYVVPQERRDWRDFPAEQQPLPPPPHPELQYGQYHYPSPVRPWQSSHMENGYQTTSSFHSYFTDPHLTSFSGDQNIGGSDCSLHISLFYRGSLVKEVTTTSPEGCRITSSSSSPPSPGLEERLFAGADIVLFPYPYPQSQRQGAEKLPVSLERGVLLWMAPDGLYAKRLCQNRVYWEGPLAPFTDKPNKLEKEQTVKLFDKQHFLAELQAYAHHDCPMPRHHVVLCFGDGYPDQQRQRKMITAQVEPMFARKLVYYTQQNSGHLLRGYDHIQDHEASPTEDYATQRPLQHVQE